MFFKSDGRRYRRLRLDIDRGQFSALIVRPRPAFLAWIDEFQQRSGDGVTTYQVEDDGVYIIPDVQDFMGSTDIECFVEHIKPWMFTEEFSRFGLASKDFPGPATASSFDEYFDVELRDYPTIVPKKLVSRYERIRLPAKGK